MSNTTQYKIGDITKLTGVSADTLRYYEKIKLLSNIQRNDAGIRLYSAKDISRLKFIKRAQRMNFSLDEIKHLLDMREDPQQACVEVREITASKLKDVEAHLEELSTLRNELTLLLNLCRASEDGCPIIEDFEGEKE
ncbi:MAG: heavy metal-responsive transcriptional regulator [Gammaproteobacteria bacterium]|nr:heavy metal-responsive transcriptional regulator [Gammaproteobacteria bacterium]MDH5778139.1 heavy metal-responsive transcriptional regulator [Gammaproteobacteria bacterium]